VSVRINRKENLKVLVENWFVRYPTQNAFFACKTLYETL
jgi:hypothetical protein